MTTVATSTVDPSAGGPWDSTIRPADPSTLDEFDAVVPSSADEVVEHVRVADSALAGWSVDGRRRARVLTDWAQALRADTDTLVARVIAETGKPIAEARAEVASAADTLDYQAGLARQLTGRAGTLPDGSVSHLIGEPVGVTAFIVPWNWPVLLLIRDLSPALAAGVTAVVKASPQTSHVTDRVLELGARAGLPPEVVRVVRGDTVVAKHLLAQPEVRAVAFTGSTAVGQQIMRTAAERMIRPLLELGGKNSAVVLDDVDLDSVLPALARAAIITAGQMCMACSRVLVPRAVHAEAVRIIDEVFASFRIGHPANEDTDVGPLISSAHAAKVHGLIEQARTESRVLGGEPVHPDGLGGHFLRPAVVDGPDLSAQIVHSDVFGPVVTVEPYDDEEEALRLANGTDYGLVAAVWTADMSRGWTLARALQAGTVWLNGWNLNYPEVPGGGFKSSGLGRTRGPEGVRQFTELKHVHLSGLHSNVTGA